MADELTHSSILHFSKQGIFKRWKARWAALEASQATGLQLSVYEEEGLAMPLRIYPLAGATLEIGKGGAEERDLFAMRLVWADGKDVCFGAETEAERDAWVEALRTAVEVLHEVAEEEERAEEQASEREAAEAEGGDAVRTSGKKAGGKKKKGAAKEEEEEEEEEEPAAVSPRASASKGGGKKKKGKAKGKTAK
jgi:hypothetical protein